MNNHATTTSHHKRGHSKRTHTRRKPIQPAHQAALDFALELTRLAIGAPDSESRTDLNRAAARLRLRWKGDAATHRAAILEAITNASRAGVELTLEDILGDTGLRRDTILNGLAQLESQTPAPIIRRAPGGRRNSGRAGTQFRWSTPGLTHATQE